MISLRVSMPDAGVSLLGDPVSISHGGTNNSSAYSAGSVIFSDGTKLTEDNTNFYWDNTNNTLGLGGTPSTDTRLHLKGTTTSHIGRFDIGLDFDLVSPPTTPPGLALIASAGNIDVGTHFYRITYVTAVGETELNTGTGATTTSIVTDAGNAQVTVTLPVSSDYRVTHVNIYRAVTGGVYYSQVKKVGQVANGVTTFIDNIADASRTGLESFARGNTTNKQITVDGNTAIYVGAQNSFFGYRAGEGVMNGTTAGGENSIFGALSAISLIGSKNAVLGYGIAVGSSDSSVLIGHGAGGVGANFGNSIIMGRNSGFWNTYGNNCVILGGAKGTTSYSAHYITAIGADALNSISTGAGSLTALGAYAGKNITTSTGSTIIGAFVDAPSATTNGQLNIGNVIYGLGLYTTNVSSSTPTSSGCIGIGVNTTSAARLTLAAGSTTIAPFKLISGTNKTTAASGEVEFDGTQMFFTPSTTRNIIAQISGSTALTAGSIPFATTSGYLTQDNTNLFWDDTNNRLGIGTASPTYKVDIQDSVAGATGFGSRVKNTDPTGYALTGVMSSTDQYGFLFSYGSTHAGGSFFQNNTALISSRGLIFIGDYNLTSGGASDISFLTGGNDPTTQTRMTITDAGDIGVGISAPSYKFDVKGAINSQSTAGAAPNFNNITYCNFVAENPYNGYPAAKFLIGQNASDVNVTMLVGPLFATGATNKPSAVVVSTNASGVEATSYQTYLQQSTTLSQIITLNRSASTGAGAGTPFAISIGTGTSYSEALRVAANRHVLIGTTTDTSFAQVKIVSGSGVEPLAMMCSVNTGYAFLHMLDYTGADAAGFGYSNPSATYHADKCYFYTVSKEFFVSTDNTTTRQFKVDTSGRVGVGMNTTALTAKLHIGAGSATASTAPIKLTSGALNTTAEPGTVEFLAERFTLTPTSTARMSVMGVLFTQTADQTIANTVTETTLFGTGVTVGGGLTLPANFFVAGKTLKLHIHGYHSSTGNPNVTIKIKLGSTVVATATDVSGNGATDGFYFDGEIVCRTTGATGTVSAGGQYDEVHTSGLNMGIVQTGTTTIDTTASQVIDVTLTWGTADAGNTVTSQIAYVEVLN